MRTRATVAGLTSSAAPMAASVQPGPAWPWLALSRMRAWVRALAGATPRPIMVCSRARSCSDRTTTCRLRTSASYGGGLPGPHEHQTEPHIPQVTTDEPLGLFVTVGFVASGGPPNLFGRDGTSVAIGTWIQLIGVLTALLAGVIATRANYRKQPQATTRPRPGQRSGSPA